jgi:hypothetical protein
MPFFAFISFVSVHIIEHKYYCSFLLLNLGLHSHMLVLNFRKYRKYGYRNLVTEKEGGSGFYDNQIFADYCLSLRGQKLFTFCLHVFYCCRHQIQAIANGSLYFRKIFKAWGQGKYSTNQL